MQQKLNTQRMACTARQIRENINRARGYLRRDDLERSIACAKDALVQKSTATALGMGRTEVELLLGELCDDFGRHPRVQSFLEKLGAHNNTFFRYCPGEETLMVKKLTAFQIKMEELEQRDRKRTEDRKSRQKAEWLAAGQDCLRQKNFPKAKVYLRRVAETFGGEEDVARRIGEIFAAADLQAEAAEMFCLALERFPNDGEAWRLAIETYDAMGEFKKAEHLYLEALKVFGAHPLTYLNMAKFYYKWRKKDEAYEYAQRALGLDSNLAEAQALRDKIG